MGHDHGRYWWFVTGWWMATIDAVTKNGWHMAVMLSSSLIEGNHDDSRWLRNSWLLMLKSWKTAWVLLWYGTLLINGNFKTTSQILLESLSFPCITESLILAANLLFIHHRFDSQEYLFTFITGGRPKQAKVNPQVMIIVHTLWVLYPWLSSSSVWYQPLSSRNIVNRILSHSKTTIEYSRPLLSSNMNHQLPFK